MMVVSSILEPNKERRPRTEVKMKLSDTSNITSGDESGLAGWQRPFEGNKNNWDGLLEFFNCTVR